MATNGLDPGIKHALLQVANDYEAMAQTMETPSADEMVASITTSGRVALYGIQFDSGKNDVKPESKATMDEIGNHPKPRSRFYWELPDYHGVDWNESFQGDDGSRFSAHPSH